MSSKKKTKKSAARKATRTAKPRKVAKPAKAAKPAKKTAARGAKKAAKAKAPKRGAPKKAAKKAAAPAAKKAAAPAAKKAASKAKAPAAKKAAPRAKAAKTAPMNRRDATGHLNPKYAAELLAQSSPREPAEDRAFLRKSNGQDPLAEEMGEEFVETVTSGEDEGTEIRDRKTVEELGGPFTVTSSNTEFAEGVDGSNPKSATREPFPKS